MKPILFNTEMVRAILEGRKTVTRRVVKPKPAGDGCKPEPLRTRPGYWNTWADDFVYRQPYRTGDILYVRETFCQFDSDHVIDGAKYAYKADATQEGERARKDFGYKWRPSIHMPKEAARIFLRVTDVRVERLQDSFTAQGATIIALQDEGIDIGDHCCQCIENYGYPCCNDLDPNLGFDEDTGEDEIGGSECGMLDGVRYKYSLLWDSTIKLADRFLYGWDANPWVWVIEFEQISKEEAMRDA